MQGSFLVNDLRKVISLVDLLRDIGLGNQLSLPKVVVLGNQSSGKSSLLEQIVGLDFLPRGSGVVTRRPLELRMNNVAELKAPYAEFDQITEGSVKKKFTNFNEVRKSIDQVTDKVCGKSKQIVDKPIVLNIFSKSCPNLTIVDLPGITSIPVGEQPKDIYKITKDMALRYIGERRSIILCVIPANQDLSTSEALKIMREIDPSGERSIGCLTKIDIMNRGDDAREILKNKEIPLRYGYVGIKNRNQEDVNNNVPVEDSLKAEKKYFTTSPIYSTLPSDLFGTESLTKKLTGILYQQIKSSMPEIFMEIKKKKKEAQDELEKLGPGVTNTDAEMVNYAWRSISSFMRIYKNSINGIKNSDYNSDPISSVIREELNNLYKDQYDDPATEDISDKDIQKAMINFPGDSTIPGFPSIDAFLALLNPLLKKLQAPAYDINNKIHQIMEKQASLVISEVLTKKFPEFVSRFNDLVRRILEKYRKSLESYLNYLLDSELSYLYTNDLTYLIGDFNKPQSKKEQESAQKNPLVYELRKRIDAYYKLVVRNLRDLIPKQVFNFLIYKCLKELEFESFQFTSDVNKLKEWLNQPNDVRNRRIQCIKAIKVFDQSEKRIRMDPDISKLVKDQKKQSQYYKKFGMKSPEEQKAEKEEKISEFYRNSVIIEKKKDPKQPPSSGQQPTNSGQQPSNPGQQPSNPGQQPSGGKSNKDNFHGNPQPKTQPKTNPNPNGLVDPNKEKGAFQNFFGSPKTTTQPTQPITIVQPVQPVKQPSGGSLTPPNNPKPQSNGVDFKNFFGQPPAVNPVKTEPKVDPVKAPLTPTLIKPPTNPVIVPPVNPPPPADGKDGKDGKKKNTFNNLFGI